MNALNWIFFGPATLVAAVPYAGFLIGGILLAGQAIHSLSRRGIGFGRAWFREPPVLAGLIWLIFNLYELQLAAVFTEKLRTAEAPLRLDLLVVSPILYVLTGFAVYALISDRKAREVGDGQQNSSD
jgi:hypothetical protein